MHASFTGKGLGNALVATCTCIVAGTGGAQAQQYNPRTMAAYQQQQATAITSNRPNSTTPVLRRSTRTNQQHQASNLRDMNRRPMLSTDRQGQFGYPSFDGEN